MNPTQLACSFAALGALAASLPTLARPAEEQSDPTALVREHWDELHGALNAMSFEREAPWGEPRAGLAWSHYAAAFARLEGHGSEFVHPLARVTDAEATGDVAERRALLERFGDVLPMVRRGARSGDARPLLRWQDGLRMRIPKEVDVRACAQLALVKLLEARTSAQELDAVRSILDAQQLARDLAATPLFHCECVGLMYVAPEMHAAHLEAGLLDRLHADTRRAWLAGIRAIEVGLAEVGPELVDPFIHPEGHEHLEESSVAARRRLRDAARERLASTRAALEASL